jgi:hypothetical protein
MPLPLAAAPAILALSAALSGFRPFVAAFGMLAA